MEHKKIRKGNDIVVRWRLIDAAGEPYDLTGRSFAVELFVGKNIRVPIRNVMAVGNIVSFTYFGKSQKYIGLCDLKYIENGGAEDMITFDTHAAFELVPHSWMTMDSGEAPETVTVETVELTSTIDINGQTITTDDDGHVLANGQAISEKVLSDCNFTSEEKTKLNGVAEGAEANVIGSVSVNDTPLSPDGNKNVTIPVPTRLSHLSEDEGHRTVSDTEKGAWNGKQEALVPGTNIKNINGVSPLGRGNIAIHKNYAENNSSSPNYIENRPGGYDYAIYSGNSPIEYSDGFTRDSEEYDYILEDVIGETGDDWTLRQMLEHGYTIPCTYVPTDGELAGQTLNGTITNEEEGEGLTLHSATGDDSTEAGSLSIDLSAIPGSYYDIDDDNYRFPVQFPSKYIPPMAFGKGTGENSALQNNGNLTVFGANAVAEGTSSTVATDRGISPSTTDTEIISEWENSEGEDHEMKFALAKGESSHVEGHNNLALGNNSHAEGNGCIAGDNSSHAEGTGSKAMGKYSHAEGLETQALGTRSHAEGNSTIAYNKEAHAEGLNSVAGINPEGINPWDSTISYVAGNQVVYDSHVYTASKSSKNKKPSGGSTYWRREEGQHAEGKGTLASVRASHAEGNATQATALAAHAEGDGTTASADGAHAEGGNTLASYKYAHAEGKDTQAIQWASHTEGYNTEVGGAHVRNEKTPDNDYIAGQMSHAEGNSTIARGNAAHSEGRQTLAGGDNSHAEGMYDGTYVINKDNSVIGSIASGATESKKLYQTKTYDAAADVYEIGMKLIGYYDSGSFMNLESENITITDVYGNGSKWFKLSANLGIGNSTTITGVVFAKLEEDGGVSKCGAYGRSSHVEGINTIANNEGEHAAGYNNVSHEGTDDWPFGFGDPKKTVYSIGIGGNFVGKNAIEIMQNGDIYIYDKGGFDGTNAGSVNAHTLQTIIGDLQAAVSGVEALLTAI